MEGVLEILHEDRDPGSRYLYFLEAAGERLSLHFAGEPPAFQTGDRIRVRGVRIGRAPDLDKHEFEQVFSRPMVVIGQRGSVLKAVGRTLTGRFLTVVFIRRRGGQYHVITAWLSRRKHILIWHREMKKK